MMGVRNIITIAMDQTKRLKIHTTGFIHQFESNADEMLILLPINYDGVSLSKCKIEIHYSSPQIENGVVHINSSAEMYNNNYIKYAWKIPLEMTLVGGKLPIWIECIDKPTGIRIISAQSSLDIVELLKLDNDGLVGIAPALGQWIIKMNQTHNYANEILMQAMEQANTATRAAGLALDVLKEIKQGGE